jgi:hypothetical protein
MNSLAAHCHGYRFPPENISHSVWLCFRFSVSYRDVEELIDRISGQYAFGAALKQAAYYGRPQLG